MDILTMMHSIYPLTLVEARDQAGFELVLPTKSPEILSFLGAAYDGDLHFVRIFYLLDQTLWGPNTNGLLVNEERIPASEDCALCGFIVGESMALDANKDGKIVPKFTMVQIGNVTGQYAAGDWENYNPDKGSWTWNPDPYSKRLRWQANGVAFELSYFGMELTQADLIAIAESMK
jgi:hypothetical protein